MDLTSGPVNNIDQNYEMDSVSQSSNPEEIHILKPFTKINLDMKGIDWATETLDNLVTANNYNMAHVVCYLKGEISGIKTRIEEIKREILTLSSAALEEPNKIIAKKDKTIKLLLQRNDLLARNNAKLDDKNDKHIEEINHLQKVINDQNVKIQSLQDKFVNFEQKSEKIMEIVDRIQSLLN